MAKTNTSISVDFHLKEGNLDIVCYDLGGGGVQSNFALTIDGATFYAPKWRLIEILHTALDAVREPLE